MTTFDPSVTVIDFGEAADLLTDARHFTFTDLRGHVFIEPLTGETFFCDDEAAEPRTYRRIDALPLDASPSFGYVNVRHYACTDDAGRSFTMVSDARTGSTAVVRDPPCLALS